MEYLKVCTYSTILFTSIIITVITVIQVTKFTSEIKYYNSTIRLNETLQGEIQYWSEIRGSAFIDISLLSVFIIQHSFCIPLFKKLMSFLQLEVLERCIFNVLSSMTIQILMYYWVPIKDSTIWNIDVFDDYKIWWLFSGLQCLGWIMILYECLVMDITYLLGLKQVYFHLTGRPAPITLRSHEFRYLSYQKAHSVTGFLIVFWVYPCMRLDRFVMALILSLFMFIATDIDDNAYNYILDQDRRKRSEL